MSQASLGLEQKEVRPWSGMNDNISEGTLQSLAWVRSSRQAMQTSNARFTGYQDKFLVNPYEEFSHFNFGFTVLEANKIPILNPELYHAQC